MQSKDSKALLGETYTDYSPDTIEVETEPGKRGQTRINALPLEVVTADWLTRAYRGNRQAFSLAWALLTESLERRFDAAFGIARQELERNTLLSQRVDQLQRDLSHLGEAFAMDDEIRHERDYLAQVLRDHGINPYGLPSDDNR